MRGEAKNREGDIITRKYGKPEVSAKPVCIYANCRRGSITFQDDDD